MPSATCFTECRLPDSKALLKRWDGAAKREAPTWGAGHGGWRVSGRVYGAAKIGISLGLGCCG